VRQNLDQRKTQESGRVDFAGKALVQIVLSAVDAVSGFMCLGKVQGTGSSANIMGCFSKSERKSMQGLYSECHGIYQ